MVLSDIAGQTLFNVLEKKSSKTACGIDGWRMAEIKRLPLPLLDAFADFFNKVEEEGEWPAVLTTALVKLLPKGEVAPVWISARSR